MNEWTPGRHAAIQQFAEVQGGLPSTGVHANQLWGDINVVNGVPWPVLDIKSTWHRFRVLNASPSRPWILQVTAVVMRSRGHDTLPSCTAIREAGAFQ